MIRGITVFGFGLRGAASRLALLAGIVTLASSVPAWSCVCQEGPIWVVAYASDTTVCENDNVRITVASAFDHDCIGTNPDEWVSDEVYVSFYDDGVLKSGPTLKQSGVMYYDTSFATPGPHTIIVEVNDEGNPVDDETVPDPIYTHFYVYVDCAPPYVEMTNPPGGEIHVASGQTSAQLAGTATDGETGIASVKVGFTESGVSAPPTSWNTADYNIDTHVWTYNWTNPQSKRIWVRAQDSGGNITTIDRAVTVSTDVQVVYVTPGGAGSKDGSSWGNAEDRVQDAINRANTFNPKREVWVVAGTYQENITIPAGVGLFGAFAGNETERQVLRAWLANQTILQGDNPDSVVTIASGAAENTVLDGFTIQYGLGNASNYCGGGVYCVDASPTISHNVITANGFGYPSAGGGIFCSGGSPVILENTISANRAGNGGGIYCYGSSATISRNVINNHLGVQTGGGISLDSCPSCVVTNNTITRNWGAFGGGIYCYNSGGRIADNAITYNISYYWGVGGIYCYDYESTLVPEITNNTIAYNNTGGIYCNSCSPSIVNNIVSSNSTGVSIYGGCNPVIHTNCINETTPYVGWGTNPPPPSFDLLIDPLLVGVHLQSGSQCIDAGDNSVVQAGDTDIDDQVRKLPSDNPNPVVDIGADEWNELDNGVGAPIITTELDFFSSILTYCGN